MGKLNHIQQKKPIFPVGEVLSEFLRSHSRGVDLPIGYDDLMRYESLMPKRDKNGEETLWTAVLYRPGEFEDLHDRLVEVYQLLIADGSPIDHLRVDSVDFCAYGNSQPFRIKIQNQINDNHDYFYIKKADASRIYGLELEELLSPNKINYLFHDRTLVEEHIIGVPGDEFIANTKKFRGDLNQVRLCKEFVKFNERCYARLLGDMRAYNFVVVVNQDFDQVQYRLRSIDFDQQCYEGRTRIYLPQFYKENLPYVRFAQQFINAETAKQYENEERSLIRKRYSLSQERIEEMLNIMRQDEISKPSYVKELSTGLGKIHGSKAFKECRTMGDVLALHLKARLELP